MSALPVLTDAERAQALDKARAARRERSAALAAVKNGSITLADFLASTDDVLKRTRVSQVVLAVPGVGKVRAARVMEQAGITAGRRVGGLGSHQRVRLTDALAA